MTQSSGITIRHDFPVRAPAVHAPTALAPGSPFDATSTLHDLHFSDEQKRVLDCLQSAPGGLTPKQIEKYSSGSPEGIRAALEKLVRAHLVCELNTVVPSYAYRYPGIRLYDE